MGYKRVLTGIYSTLTANLCVSYPTYDVLLKGADPPPFILDRQPLRGLCLDCWWSHIYEAIIKCEGKRPSLWLCLKTGHIESKMSEAPHEFQGVEKCMQGDKYKQWLSSNFIGIFHHLVYERIPGSWMYPFILRENNMWDHFAKVVATAGCLPSPFTLPFNM